MEDEERQWQLLLAVLPAARTPMDRKSGRAMQKWMREIRKNLSEFLVPWIRERRIKRIRERLKKPPVGYVLDEKGNVVDLNKPGLWRE